jgi:hypothetical protein
MKYARQSKQAERRRAIQRGMEFVYRTACEPENFDVYGFDYLFCFNWIFSTSKDKYLRDMALEMGQERARFWRRTHSALPRDIDADTITHFVFASDAADRLGFRDKAIKAEIRGAAEGFSARDYFWFDPVSEPPSRDVPESCECGADNPRGRRSCGSCKEPLTMMSRYEVWLVALIRSYVGERYGVKLGARYLDVLKWLPSLRPYCGPENGHYPDFVWAVYAVTHVVYTLNDYGVYNLSRNWLPYEFAFLKKHINEAITMEDPETMGEFLDSLKSFSLPDSHPLIRQGEEFILSRQNADGSWGEMDVDDIYDRYHPTIAALDGLRKYSWRGLGLSFPSVMPLLEEWAISTGDKTRKRKESDRRTRDSLTTPRTNLIAKSTHSAPHRRV